ncbi:MAG: hypothetical protein KJ927_04475, partial [Candidatus Eisenbacteria bacterium]|nr:hypothetical protein [Candidatus Eisenbacteria bacterium]
INTSDPVRVLETYQHANVDVLAIELYAYTDLGEDTRDESYWNLRNLYTADQIVRADRDTSIPYYGIGVTADFFKEIFTEYGITGPDLYFILGCDTGDSPHWERLIEEIGVRCLITLRGNEHTNLEAMLPWYRMNGTDQQGYFLPDKRLRTLPLAFQQDEWIGSNHYLDYNGMPLYDVDFAAGIDSMALTPTVFSTTTVENKIYDDLPIQETVVYSCKMNPNVPSATMSGLGGAWVWGETWVNDYTLTFNVESVKLDAGSNIRYNSMRSDTVMTRSMQGNHPVSWSGRGPVGNDWLVPVICIHDDPNNACAYDPISAWRDGNELKVWLQGTEAGVPQPTTLHRILGGPNVNEMRELATIPGSGQHNYIVDELITITEAEDIIIIQVQEEPDGSTSRVNLVLDNEPSEHLGHVHQSGMQEFVPTEQDEYDIELFREECPDWIIYGPMDLMLTPELWTVFAILNNLGYDDIEMVPAIGNSAWYLKMFLALYQEAFGTVPKGATIIGSGCDDPEHPDNIISPYKWDGCEECYWTPWQSGDAHYGVLNQDWEIDGWHPDVGITRIPGRTQAEVGAYCLNAMSYHQQALDSTLPRRALVLLGDEEDSGIAPDTSISVYNWNVLPSLENDGWAVQVMKDSDYPNNINGYLQSHIDFADIRNGNNWCSYITSIGPVSAASQTPGYLVHKGSGSNPWDGSLFDPELERPFGMFAPGCGSAGIFRNTAYRPALAGEFLNQAAWWVGCSSGGLESLHKEWMMLWNYYMPISNNTYDCYQRCLQTFALRYSEHFEYAMGMVYIGIPMQWQDMAASVEYIER